ncbi:MAG: hypothetical protein COB42_06695 [Sulfurimonas sp.]|nr:MAG: hypothetical protein COB42_06695 [Sulfurimonas sp.]
MIESWMLSLFIAILGVATTWGILKNKIESLLLLTKSHTDLLVELQKFKNENNPLLLHLSKIEEKHGRKIENQAKDLIALQTKLANVPTMEEVRSEFVSKEMFKQMEKHFDENFDRVEEGLNKIFKKIER